jgi:NAD+ kinase
MERVGLLVHPTRPVLDALKVVQRWTRDHGLGLIQIPVGEQPVLAPPGEVDRCDLIVALGGDGTILKALHASARTGTPVLGVAYGSLGALTTVPTDQLEAGLDRFAAGEWRARRLPALAIEAGELPVPPAINDLVVVRGAGTQLRLDVSVDGELYVRLAGDGVIVATPTGSSAYSMAAGGAIVTDTAEAVLCTPLAMHGGCAPPLVVAGDAEITLDVHPSHGGFRVDVDGFPVRTDAPRFEITRHEGYAVLVAFDDSRTSIPRLRKRGLISDSPRVLRELRAAAHEPAGSRP